LDQKNPKNKGKTKFIFRFQKLFLEMKNFFFYFLFQKKFLKFEKKNPFSFIFWIFLIQLVLSILFFY